MEQQFDLEKVKQINKRIQWLASGFVRESRASFPWPTNDAYYDIPPLIPYIVLSFYYIPFSEIKEALDAWREISRDKPSLNWYICQLKDEKKMKSTDLKVVACGGKGLNELIAYLSNKQNDARSKIYFILFRVEGGENNDHHRRFKFVHVRFVGGYVKVMRKAKLTPLLGRIAEHFPVKHLTYDWSEESLPTVTHKHIATEFSRFSGVHKPDFYDFGDGHIEKTS